jgi:hypothetical protein
VPDAENGRLLVYNSPSSASCPGIDIVEVPLDDPASASYLRFEESGRSCHDTGVILGDAMMAACAGGNGFTLWSLGDSLENPTDAEEIAYADPAPLSETQLVSGGDWSTYWYDGLIYESDITRGLMTWNLSDRAVAGARKLGHLNP